MRDRSGDPFRPVSNLSFRHYSSEREQDAKGLGS
jgi:hypothetical protein